MPKSLRNFSFVVLAYTLAVIVWGAYVRASGSGAGCGDHWPLCDGQLIVREASVQKLIELTHRGTSGIALLLVIALVFRALRILPKEHFGRGAAWLTLGFMLSESAVGAMLVLFKLVAENESMARAMFMAVHLANTFFLLGSLAYLCYALAGGEAPRWSGQRSIHVLVVPTATLFVLLGVSGAIAALGDTLYPATSLEHGFAQDLSPTAHVFVRLRVLHPLLALALAALIAITAVMLTQSRPAPLVRRSAITLGVLFVLQLGAGLLNVLLLAPIWLQLVHLVLADAVWITFVLLSIAALAAPAPAPEPEPVALAT